MGNGNVVKRISHPVVAVNPNGTVAGYFSSIKEAAVKSGRGRHAISLSCRKGSICKGFKWYYEKDFRKLYKEQRMDELKFSPDPNREKTLDIIVKGISNIKDFRTGQKNCKKREELFREKTV